MFSQFFSVFQTFSVEMAFRLDAGRGALGRFVPPIGMGFTHGPERARCILSHERRGLTESCWDRCAVKNDSMLGPFFQGRTYVLCCLN